MGPVLLQKLGEGTEIPSPPSARAETRLWGCRAALGEQLEGSPRGLGKVRVGWEVWPALPGLMPALPCRPPADGALPGGVVSAELHGQGKEPAPAAPVLDGEHWGVAGFGWRGAMLTGRAQPAVCRASENQRWSHSNRRGVQHRQLSLPPGYDG